VDGKKKILNAFFLIERFSPVTARVVTCVWCS